MILQATVSVQIQIVGSGDGLLFEFQEFLIKKTSNICWEIRSPALGNFISSQYYLTYQPGVPEK